MGALLRETIREIAADPARYVVEFAQTLLVVVGCWWFGRRWFAKRLAERGARVNASLDAAESDVSEAARLRAEAPQVVEQAKRDAAALLRATTDQSAAERVAAESAIAGEARAVVEQAQATIDQEKARVRRESAERLVRLTTEAARDYLDAMVTESERRVITERAIGRFVDELESQVAAPAAGAR